MGVVFQVKGTSLDAFYSRQGKEAGVFKYVNDADPAVTSYADPSVFGGQAINLSNPSTYPKGLVYPGFRNFSMNQAWTIRMRIVPFWDGTPPASQCLFTFARFLDIGGTYPQFHCFLRGDGQLQFVLFGPKDGGPAYYADATGDIFSCTNGQAFEFQLSWTGLTGGGSPNSIKYSRDGAHAINLGVPGYAWDANSWKWIDSLKFGFVPGQMGVDATKFAINEILIFDTAESPTYTARTDFDSSRSAADALSNTDPGAAYVLAPSAGGPSGYTINGVSLTGSLVSGSPPSPSDVRYGTTFIDNSGVTQTGSLQVPAQFTGTSGQVNYAQIKENLIYAFEQANTTTADYDLSTGLDHRVQRITTLHPGRIPLQPSYYPYVSIFVDSKDVELSDIAINQKNAKRKSKVRLKIVGGVWSSKVPDKRRDRADDQCERLMESVEEILRRYPTIDGQCLWSAPTGVTYHNKAIDEEASLRVGILSLDLVILA